MSAQFKFWLELCIDSLEECLRSYHSSLETTLPQLIDLTKTVKNLTCKLGSILNKKQRRKTIARISAITAEILQLRYLLSSWKNQKILDESRLVIILKIQEKFLLNWVNPEGYKLHEIREILEFLQETIGSDYVTDDDINAAPDCHEPMINKSARLKIVHKQKRKHFRKNRKLRQYFIFVFFFGFLNLEIYLIRFSTSSKFVSSTMCAPAIIWICALGKSLL